MDPGASGAIVIYDDVTQSLTIYDMPTYEEKVGTEKRVRVDAEELGRWLRRQLAVDVAYIEKVGARPNQGVSSMFAFGRAAGIVEGALGGLGVPLRFLRPQQWQRLAYVAGGEFVKDNARAKAQKLFPKQAAEFKRKKDSGRADAALIAYAGALDWIS